ncbi:hypothetical protein F503_01824 [Ophiostoma piceae UAMH 11346]|uniref:Uncharacterized protein n=1 Tax=Ophiostoma piceae (strain UAMH 11346) TaxID=1262450 RepID=S3BRM3_OPHP1|nr:hypothetical protein F503_01824 [Ophiostoma piceae UAMH 11346]
MAKAAPFSFGECVFDPAVCTVISTTVSHSTRLTPHASYAGFVPGTPGPQREYVNCLLPTAFTVRSVQCLNHWSQRVKVIVMMNTAIIITIQLHWTAVYENE